MSLHVYRKLTPASATRFNVREFAFAFTEANHVSCEGEVEVNGADYRVHIHLYRLKDGTWNERWSGATQQRTIYLTKCDHRPVSSAAKTKIEELLPQLLSDAIREMPDLEEVRKEAEISSASHYMERREAEIDELLKTVAVKKKIVNDLANCISNAKKGELPPEYTVIEYEQGEQ